MSKKRSHQQTVSVVILDKSGHIQLSCARKFAANGGDDGIRVVAKGAKVPAPEAGDCPDGEAGISLQIAEAEDFFELVMPLVSDSKERPFAGSLNVNTISDKNVGARFSVTLENANDYDARVELYCRDREGEKTIGFDVNRTVLEHWLKASLDGICEDLEEDD